MHTTWLPVNRHAGVGQWHTRMWTLQNPWTASLLLALTFMGTPFIGASDACAPCSCTERSVNCSYRHLQQVPNNLPPGALSLDLSHNLLHYLPDNVFQRLTNLTVLDLSYNCLTNLTPSVFVGLCSLQWLSLSWNNISLSDENYPEGVFSPFNTTLLHLYLNGNSPPNTTLTLNVSYPDKALSQLSNLTTLFMDGLNDARFGAGFGHLLRLTNLSLVGFENGFCDLVVLHNDTFTHHPPVLQSLNLSYCNIRYIEADAFGPLQSLQILDISHNEDLGFQRLGLAVYGLYGSALHTLYINRINRHYTVCATIHASDTMYFKNTSIKTIYAKHNSLQFFSQGALLNMPDSLQFVSLVGNHLAFGSYLQDLNKLRGLKQVENDGYSSTPNVPSHFPVRGNKYRQDKVDGKFVCESSPDHCRLTAVLERRREASWLPQLGHEPTEQAADNKTYFVLPPNLTDFRSRQSQIYYKVMQVDFDPDNNLISLDLNSNFLVKLMGPVTGLDKLEYLDLGSNLLYRISDKFFQNFTSLKVLHLNRNSLRNLTVNSASSIFAPLASLEILDLSQNYIYNIPKTAFSGLAQLRVLNLSYNDLISLNVDISSAKSLRVIDLAFNSIHSLPIQVRDHLDLLADNSSNTVTVNITYNHIICTCENIDFLSWMEKTKVHFPKDKVYFCLLSDGSVQRWINIFDVIASLQQQCTSYVGAFIGAISCCFCLLLALVSALVYRFRWKLRYLYYASRMSYRRTQSEHHQFLFDAFVSYASEDEDFVHGQLVHRLEEQENLRLNVHSRDFTPGKPIACNIVAAVQNSRRTLVVLTRRLLQSDWCQYEMQMATMEAVHTGRDVLLFLLYEDIPSHELPRKVLYNLQSSTYIQFPHDDPSLLATFWSRLERIIRM